MTHQELWHKQFFIMYFQTSLWGWCLSKHGYMAISLVYLFKCNLSGNVALNWRSYLIILVYSFAYLLWLEFTSYFLEFTTRQSWSFLKHYIMGLYFPLYRPIALFTFKHAPSPKTSAYTGAEQEVMPFHKMISQASIIWDKSSHSNCQRLPYPHQYTVVIFPITNFCNTIALLLSIIYIPDKKCYSLS